MEWIDTVTKAHSLRSWQSYWSFSNVSTIKHGANHRWQRRKINVVTSAEKWCLDFKFTSITYFILTSSRAEENTKHPNDKSVHHGIAIYSQNFDGGLFITKCLIMVDNENTSSIKVSNNFWIIQIVASRKAQGHTICFSGIMWPISPRMCCIRNRPTFWQTPWQTISETRYNTLRLKPTSDVFQHCGDPYFIASVRKNPSTRDSTPAQNSHIFTELHSQQCKQTNKNILF